MLVTTHHLCLCCVQVLLRLLTGQTVRIGVVGGSVTVARLDPEHGGYL